jgi:NACalpha-BTF3-like transcription factor
MTHNLPKLMQRTPDELIKGFSFQNQKPYEFLVAKMSLHSSMKSPQVRDETERHKQSKEYIIDPYDVELVQSQTSAAITIAEEALKKSKGDIVEAILDVLQIKTDDTT